MSGAILLALYFWLDPGAILAAARKADPLWLTLGLLLCAPLVALSAWRFAILVERDIGMAEAVRLTLGASTLNLFLPSKLGDLAKAGALRGRHAIPASLAVAIVVLEKLLDLGGLLVWGAAALIVVAPERPALLLLLLPVGALLALLTATLLPGTGIVRLAPRIGPRRMREAAVRFSSGWDEVLAYFWGTPGLALRTVALSLLLWALHLMQFWVFARALGGDIPVVHNAAYATLAILAGLLPFTFAGVGTRDAVIVLLYGPLMGEANAAILGLLATMRYVLPALAGVPFVARLLTLTRRPG